MVSVRGRQTEILALLAHTGRVGVGMLAEHFGVTSETIRRDLRVLEDRGQLDRVHGGAIPPGKGVHATTPQPDPTTDVSALARLAVSFIQPDTRGIFLDSGPVALAVAAVLGEIHGDGRWTVVTTSPAAGMILARAGLPRITMTGGRVSRVSQSLTGRTAVEMITAMRAEIAFVCPDGLVDAHSVTALDPAAGATRRAMITNSSFTVMILPAASLGQPRGITFGDLSEADVVVTDADPATPPLMFPSASNIQVVTP